jgi:hypothetical protein
MKCAISPLFPVPSHNWHALQSGQLPSLFSFLVFLILLGSPGPSVNADELMEDSQVWAGILSTGTLKPLGDKWHFWLEGQGRFGNDVTTLSQGFIRPGVGYALSEHVSIWFGYAHIFTDTPFARTSFDEERVWQQLIWSQPLGAGSFTSRGRLEQRFLDTLSDTGWRYRQFFKIAYPIRSLPGVSAVAFDEVFVNLNDVSGGAQAGFDQNRAFAGLGYAFTKRVKTEVGYLHQFIDRPVNPNRVTNALAINLFLNFP